jgi:4-amino-4-deoxy-L-arabinose transferase-like glycosyltransferase
MDMGLAGRRKPEIWGRSDGLVTSARSLVPPTPRSVMYFPLVVLVAILPGLYALNWWDLTPPGPWWGLRALTVLEGNLGDQASAVSSLSATETKPYLDVAYQPPLYAWLAAVGLGLTTNHAPWASVLPSYIAGAFVVILVYLHGRLWRKPGVGLAAAVLTGCNRSLLLQMQQASPTTLALVCAVAALYAYAQHLRGAPGATGAWPWGGGTGWLVAGGLALGLGLLSEGGFALLVLPVALLHQAYLVAEVPASERPFWRRLRLGWRDNPSLVAGALVLAIGLVVSGPWYARMFALHGRAVFDALLAPPEPVGPGFPGLLSRLVDLTPATLPLGLFGAVRAIRQALVAEADDDATTGGVLWVFWLAVAALAPSFWPTGPRATFDPFLLIPLNLLAAQAMSDLAHRAIPIRVLNLLAPATAVCVAWWVSANLREAVAELARGRASWSTGLGLHLALDLLIGAVLFTRWLERWARRRDDRQRRVLAGFLFAVLATTVAGGLSRVSSIQYQTADYLKLRDVILSRHHAHPFREVAIIGPDARPYYAPDPPTTSGRLRFILRSTLPGLPARTLSTTDDLLALPAPAGPRLVILIATDQRLSNSVQGRLNLEAIFPSTSSLDAFATSHTPARRP